MASADCLLRSHKFTKLIKLVRVLLYITLISSLPFIKKKQKWKIKKLCRNSSALNVQMRFLYKYSSQHARKSTSHVSIYLFLSGSTFCFKAFWHKCGNLMMTSNQNVPTKICPLLLPASAIYCCWKAEILMLLLNLKKKKSGWFYDTIYTSHSGIAQFTGWITF